jgi:hypothetical protein
MIGAAAAFRKASRLSSSVISGVVLMACTAPSVAAAIARAAALA